MKGTWFGPGTLSFVTNFQFKTDNYVSTFNLKIPKFKRWYSFLLYILIN